MTPSSSVQTHPSENNASVTNNRNVTVGIVRLEHAPKALPNYATAGSAGIDLQAATTEAITLKPMERTLIPTGFVFEIPEGYECQIRARSGLSIKHGITLINAVGTIDSDYRDEIKVPVVNLSNDSYTIQPGDRVAQVLLAPVYQIEWDEHSTVTRVESRSGGFGSTGMTGSAS